MQWPFTIWARLLELLAADAVEPLVLADVEIVGMALLDPARAAR